jgi:hypothetical protein
MFLVQALDAGSCTVWTSTTSGAVVTQRGKLGTGLCTTPRSSHARAWPSRLPNYSELPNLSELDDLVDTGIQLAKSRANDRSMCTTSQTSISDSMLYVMYSPFLFFFSYKNLCSSDTSKFEFSCKLVQILCGLLMTSGNFSCKSNKNKSTFLLP